MVPLMAASAPLAEPLRYYVTCLIANHIGAQLTDNPFRSNEA